MFIFLFLFFPFVSLVVFLSRSSIGWHINNNCNELKSVGMKKMKGENFEKKRECYKNKNKTKNKTNPCPLQFKDTQQSMFILVYFVYFFFHICAIAVMRTRQQMYSTQTQMNNYLRIKQMCLDFMSTKCICEKSEKKKKRTFPFPRTFCSKNNYSDFGFVTCINSTLTCDHCYRARNYSENRIYFSW